MSAVLKNSLGLGRKVVSTQTKKRILSELGKSVFSDIWGGEGREEPEVLGLITRILQKEFGKTEMHSSCHFEFLILLDCSIKLILVS